MVLDGTTALQVAVDRPQVTYGRAVVGDFNGDGNLDFAREAQYPVSTPTPQTADVVDVFLGDGRGGFVLDTTLTFDHVRAMIAGDVNGGRRPACSSGTTLPRTERGRPSRIARSFWAPGRTFTQQFDVVNAELAPGRVGRHES